MADNAAGAQGGAGTTNAGTEGGAQGGGSGSYRVTDGGGTGGGGAQGGGGGAGGGGRESKREVREQGAATIVDRLVQRYGSEQRALDVLSGELYDMREERRELLDKQRQLPPAGAIVLVGDDVKAWDAYKALNLPADKLKERLAEGDRLLAESKQKALGTVAEQAAQAVGYKNAAVLGDLLTDKQLLVEMRDTVVTTNGKSENRKMPYARKVADTNGHFTPLADYINANHGGYVPALNTAPQGGAQQQGGGGSAQSAQGGAGGTNTGGAGTNTGTQGGQGTVTVFAEQQGGGGGGGGPTDAVARRLAANKAAADAPNALRPAAATK